jgi:hypothetical protein
MAFLFQDQNQGTRNETPREKMRRSRPFSFIRTLTVGFGIAPNLLTLLRKGFHEGNSSEEGARGLGLFHPYRRWGLSPRPENIGCPGWAALRELWRMGGAPASAFPWEIRMSPCRQSETRSVSDLPELAVGASQSDSRRAYPARLTRIRRIRVRFVLVKQKLTPKDELWTRLALPVDGPGVQLRGFRKSHHLMPAAPGATRGLRCAVTPQVNACRPAGCVSIIVIGFF